MSAPKMPFQRGFFKSQAPTAGESDGVVAPNVLSKIHETSTPIERHEEFFNNLHRNLGNLYIANNGPSKGAIAELRKASSEALLETRKAMSDAEPCKPSVSNDPNASPQMKF